MTLSSGTVCAQPRQSPRIEHTRRQSSQWVQHVDKAASSSREFTFGPDTAHAQLRGCTSSVPKTAAVVRAVFAALVVKPKLAGGGL
jgi:hypothetical protein